ncbi:transposase [Methanogenium marinum]|uniref:transposase n=1 Tax=Methanogenium marinum TaxID=348610 RepID=UPI003B84AA09
MSKEFDEHVHEFLNRPIESRFPYILVDATYFNVCDGMGHVNKALLITVVVREDEYREILGARITNCENEEFCSGMCSMSLRKKRGLEGGKLVVSGYTVIQKTYSNLFRTQKTGCFLLVDSLSSRLNRIKIRTQSDVALNTL